MIRLMLAAATLSLSAGLASAETLAGGPAPNIVRTGTNGTCGSAITTETMGGVRIHRGTTTPCEAAPSAGLAPRISSSTEIDVRVDTQVELRERRMGTSPYVLGAPRSDDDGYYGTNPYVLGAPGGF